MEHALRHLLVNDPDIGALVGTRVHDVHLPQGKRHPSILYQINGVQRVQTLDGPVPLPTSQVTLYLAADGAQARKTLGTLAGYVRALLSGFRGEVFVNDTGEPVMFDMIQLDDESDFPRHPDTGQDVTVKSWVMHFQVHWRE